MKKYSIEARELLSAVELYNIKAGGGGKDKQIAPQPEKPTCGVMCASCVGCTSCTACTTRYLDVIIFG